MGIEVRGLPAPPRRGSAREVAITSGPRRTRTVPAAISREAAETCVSRSEKIVGAIAISVLIAGFAAGALGVSDHRSLHAQPHVRQLQTATDWRHQ